MINENINQIIVFSFFYARLNNIHFKYWAAKQICICQAVTVKCKCKKMPYNHF